MVTPINNSRLHDAIRSFDLPQYLMQRYPGCFRGTLKDKGWNSAKAVWRGDKHNSFGLKRGQDGRWVGSDFGAGWHGDALDFMTKVEGISFKDAFALIVGEQVSARPANIKVVEQAWAEAKPYTISQQTRDALPKAQQMLLELGLPATAQGRCWDIELCELVGMGRGRAVWEKGSDGRAAMQWLGDPQGHDYFLPFHHPETGEHITTYARISQGPVRFGPCDLDAGSPAWYSPNWLGAGRGIILSEGPGKALSNWHSTFYNDFLSNYAVIGLQNTGSSVPVEIIKKLNLPLYIFPDPGNPDKARSVEFSLNAGRRWLKQAKDAGIEAYLCDPIGDSCDIAHAAGEREVERGGEYLMGNATLARRIIEAIVNARNGYTKFVQEERQAKGQRLAARMASSLKPSMFKGKSRDAQLKLAQHILERIASNNRMDWLEDGRAKIRLTVDEVRSVTLIERKATAISVRRRVEQWLDCESVPPYLVIDIQSLTDVFNWGTDSQQSDVEIEHGKEPAAIPHLGLDFQINPSPSDGVSIMRLGSGGQVLLYEAERQAGEFTTTDVCHLWGTHRSTTLRRLREFEQWGFIERSGRGKWRISATAREALRQYRHYVSSYHKKLRQRISAEIRRRSAEWAQRKQVYAKTAPHRVVIRHGEQRGSVRRRE